MGRQRLLPEHHVRRPADFQRAYRLRCTACDELLLVFGCPSGLPYPRLGLSVSRKRGKATVRNRQKRLLREAFRLCREELPAGIDLVVVPRWNAEPRLSDLRSSLPRLAVRVTRKAMHATGGHKPSNCGVAGD